MGFLDSIEKLINEHGSATILRERIALAKDQYAALEKKVMDLQLENERLKSDNSKLQEQMRNLEKKIPHNSNPRGYVCDHCGSPNLKRIGNRSDPMFGDLGIKQAIFSCTACGKESAFTQNP
jgi:regulator of replication initiation timing